MTTEPSLLYLGAESQEALKPSSDELLRLTEEGVALSARDDTVILPTTGLPTRSQGSGALYSVRAACPSIGLAMVKTVGAYPENRGLGLSPDFGLAVLHHAQTGQPLAVLDAGPLTRWRTAALAAWAALRMARAPSRVLCVIGARGIAPIAAELICEGAEIAEVRFISRSAGTAREAADALSRSRPVAARAARDIEDAMDGADIVLDGPGLSAHTALLPAAAIGPGTTVVSYGAFSSLPADILSHTDGLIVDRWVEGDTGATGALGPAIAAGRAERRHVRALLPDIATGRTAGRHGDDERLLVVLRGLAPCDITLSRHLAEAATTAGAGIRLPA